MKRESDYVRGWNDGCNAADHKFGCPAEYYKGYADGIRRRLWETKWLPA